MELLISTDYLSSLRSRESAPLRCQNCGDVFHRPKNEILRALAPHTKRTLDCCSRKCSVSYVNRHRPIHECRQCNKPVKRPPSQVTQNVFCSMSCAGIYNNAHKRLGKTRISYAERYLCKLIRDEYPSLTLLTNVRDVLTDSFELDIFIPERRLAIEVNGVIHYEPIFGQEKLQKIQASDSRKVTECHESGIRLIVIDISPYRHHRRLRPFLDGYFANSLIPILEPGGGIAAPSFPTG